MTPDTHLAVISVQLTRTVDEILANASKVGSENGLPANWRPNTPTEAIYEILASSDDPEKYGVRLCSRSARGKDGTYEIKVLVRFGWNREAVREDVARLVGKPDLDLDESIGEILTHSLSPVELGIEVVKIETPSSKHAIAADFQMAQRALTPA